MLVRFVAAALIGWALAELALYLVITQHNGTPVSDLTCAVKALPSLAGIAMLVKAKALAEWLAEKLDL